MSEATKPTLPEAISNLERAVFERRTLEGVKLLLALLTQLAQFTDPNGISLPNGTEYERRAAYTRVAAMISALLCSPDFQITLDQITELCGRKPVLETIFELSGYEGPHHLLGYVGTKNEAGHIVLRSNQILVIALFYSLDDLPPELLSGVLQLPPDLMLPLVLGWFAAPFVHSQRGEENRRAIITACERLETATPTGTVVQAITSAWMHCSYADSPQKHHFKKSLNAIWLRLGTMAGVKGRSAERRLSEKPHLVIPAERMTVGHAMHRSYASCLAQLRTKFRVTCLVHKGFFSDANRDLFDDVVVMQQGMNFKEPAAHLVRLQPDIIYYPSLGMSDWTQMVANHRFAPIQLMTLGHPAPPMCDTIDYALVSPGVGEVCWEYSRKVVELRATPRFEPHGDVVAHQVSGEKFDDGRLHLAVNSSLMKLSPRFLALCERLEAESKKTIHFHFFASATGVAHDRLRQVFQRRFRYFTLEPSRRYGDFLKVLERCHVAVAAFPFGNTNSTVDTCLVHVPTVAFKGNEPLSIFDRDVLRMAGMPEWLACDTDEAYFQTAMRLIHDDEQRAELVELLKKSDLRKMMFEWQAPGNEMDFVATMDWIYRNHEALQASSAHVLRSGEPIPT